MAPHCLQAPCFGDQVGHHLVDNIACRLATQATGQHFLAASLGKALLDAFKPAGMW